jgi:hypothetical protein
MRNEGELHLPNDYTGASFHLGGTKLRCRFKNDSLPAKAGIPGIRWCRAVNVYSIIDTETFLGQLNGHFGLVFLF